MALAWLAFGVLMADSMSTRRQPGGIWKDERRSPGPWPQGRRKPLAIVAAIVAALLARVLVRRVFDQTALGVLVILIGLTSFWVAARLDRGRLDRERYGRGPGWWISLLISKTSVPVARGIYVAMGLGICALGVAELVR